MKDDKMLIPVDVFTGSYIQIEGNEYTFYCGHCHNVVWLKRTQSDLIGRTVARNVKAFTEIYEGQCDCGKFGLIVTKSVDFATNSVQFSVIHTEE